MQNIYTGNLANGWESYSEDVKQLALYSPKAFLTGPPSVQLQFLFLGVFKQSMRPSWRTCNYDHTYPSGSLPWTCLPQASAALVSCGLHSSCALVSPCLTTGSPLSAEIYPFPSEHKSSQLSRSSSPISAVTLHWLTHSRLLRSCAEDMLWEGEVLRGAEGLSNVPGTANKQGGKIISAKSFGCHDSRWCLS